MGSPKNIQILFPFPLFPAAQNNLFQCSWVSQINTHHCQSISTSLHTLHPQCPRLTSFPTVKDTITHHILAKRNYLLYKKLRHNKCVLWPWDQESWRRTGPQWTPVSEEREGWNLWKSCLDEEASPGGAGDEVPPSIPFYLYTADWCCYSSSLKQRGRNLN